MLTIALFGVILSVIGSLLNSASKVSRRADKLSWSNNASSWLDKIEFDITATINLNVAPGGSDSRLNLTLRKIDSPSFLPDPAPDPWNPDLPSVVENKTYEIQDEKLTVTSVSPVSGTRTSILGDADTLEIERSSEGDVTITVRLEQTSVRREVAPSLIDSERAPL